MQRFLGIIIPILIFVSFWIPSGHAQDDGVAIYASHDGAFTFTYPEKWTQRDYGFGIFLSNTGELPAHFEEAEVETGEMQLRIYPPFSAANFVLGDEPISLETKTWSLIYRLIVDVTPDELIKRSVEIIDIEGQETRLISATTVDGEHVTALAMDLDRGISTILIAVTTEGEWELFETDVLDVASTIRYEDHSPILWPEEGLPLDETVVFVDEGLVFSYPAEWTLVNMIEEHVAILANSPSAILIGSNLRGTLRSDEFLGIFHSPTRLHQLFPEIDRWDGVEIVEEFVVVQQSTPNVSVEPYSIERLTLDGKSTVVLHSNVPDSTCQELAYSIVVIELADKTFAAVEIIACPAVLLSFEDAAKAIAKTIRYSDQ